MADKCCENYKWFYIADASHADGCEFTYGKCVSCDSHLINLFHTAVEESDNSIVVSYDFIKKLLSLDVSDQKEFMRNWYNSL